VLGGAKAPHEMHDVEDLKLAHSATGACPLPTLPRMTEEET
jgi:hypothetical protein